MLVRKAMNNNAIRHNISIYININNVNISNIINKKIDSITLLN